MSKGFPYTWAAAGLGLLLALVLAVSGGADARSTPGLPLLTRLFVAEFGFLVTAGGAFWGFKQPGAQGARTATRIAAIACTALAAAFLLIGILLWSDSVGGEQATPPGTAPSIAA